MICPNKICLAEIPDDSLYCDQCRMQILRCSKCGAPGISKFCVKCGGAMVFKESLPGTEETPARAAPVQAAEPQQKIPEMPADKAPPQSPPPEPSPTQTVGGRSFGTAVDRSQNTASAATVIMPSINAKKLLLCHPDGWNMEIASGDILGRTNGNHVDRLGAIPVISGTHAKITCENDRWFITDLKSTNKTYVGSSQLQPDVPVQIKSNDVIQLANVKFIVREQ
jgi:hypothetical protein